MPASTALDDAALRRLARDVAAADSTAPLGVYLLRSDEPGAALARHVERGVFLEAFGNTPDLLVEEYGPYERSSVFFCVIDHRRRMPAGVMRVLLPSDAGFKTDHDVTSVWGEPLEVMAERTGLRLALDRTWDIATLAVAPGYRGKATVGLVSLGLYQALALAAPRSGVEWLLAILDVPVWRMIRWKLRMPMVAFAGVPSRPYLGSSASMPVWCNVRDTERRIAVSDPDIHSLYFGGVGMEPAVRPLDVVDAVAVLAELAASARPAVVSDRPAAPAPTGSRRPASTAC